MFFIGEKKIYFFGKIKIISVEQFLTKILRQTEEVQ